LRIIIYGSIFCCPIRHARDLYWHGLERNQSKIKQKRIISSYKIFMNSHDSMKITEFVSKLMGRGKKESSVGHLTQQKILSMAEERDQMSKEEKEEKEEREQKEIEELLKNFETGATKQDDEIKNMEEDEYDQYRRVNMMVGAELDLVVRKF